jgi:hypothetical protein
LTKPATPTRIGAGACERSLFSLFVERKGERIMRAKDLLTVAFVALLVSGLALLTACKPAEEPAPTEPPADEAVATEEGTEEAAAEETGEEAAGEEAAGEGEAEGTEPGEEEVAEPAADEGGEEEPAEG